MIQAQPGTAGTSEVGCTLAADGLLSAGPSVVSVSFSSSLPVETIPVSGDITLGVGTHTIEVRCRDFTGPPVDVVANNSELTGFRVS